MQWPWENSGVLPMVTAGLGHRAAWLAGLAGLALAGGIWLGGQRPGGALIICGLALLLLCAALRGRRSLASWRARAEQRRLAALTDLDPAPWFTTDAIGRILWRNQAALARYPDEAALTLSASLAQMIASPSAVLYRLQSRAAEQGGIREDVVTRSGHLRLAVHRIPGGSFLWRLEEFEHRSTGGHSGEGLSLPMMVVNAQGVVLSANEAMRQLLGSRPVRLDRILLQAQFGSGEEVSVQTAGGQIRVIAAEISQSAGRREIFFLPAPLRREADTAPVDTEHLPVALMKFSSDGRLTSCNLSAKAMLGGRPTEGLSFHDLFEELGRPVNDWLADVISQRLPGGAEMLRLRGGGEEDSFVQLQLSRIVENGVVCALAILSDVTALKRMEAQFDQSQKMQAIGQLAGGIAHDFNNLLTAISGHCDLLLLRRDEEDHDYADLTQIRQNANRAASLVSQLLSFSRKQTLKPERLDLPDVLGELVHLLNRLVGEKVQIRQLTRPGLQPVRADRRRLEQVLINLVVNARDAMAGKGVITIESETLTYSAPVLRDGATVPAGDWTMIRISDTGCGIPPERMHKIFEPFYTTKRAGEGTGLGLPTVYGIVKQSGGYVFAASEPGQGAQFDLLFPVAGDMVPAPVTEPLPRGQRAGPGAGTVLLAEDEAAVRAFAARALRMRGYTVLECASAEEALELLEDPGLHVDLFVSDMVMLGLDGPSWVKRALETRPGVRVVFMSGYAQDHLAADQAQVPHSVFLPKPFSLTDLTTTVQEQLR